ncbi:MAG TPA: DUF1501 domain-containing protein, partial [Gemmatales bacterium]|nr:DUF1501 domain-containing protein [Gemmatales bacterium]
MNITRRDWLNSTTHGLLGLGLYALLSRDRPLRAASLPLDPLPLGRGMTTPKAKRVVQFFMAGGASHLDLFDYKPALIKHHGQKS